MLLLEMAKENIRIFLSVELESEKQLCKRKQNFINPRQRKPQIADITRKKRETYYFDFNFCDFCAQTASILNIQVNRINEQILRDPLSPIILSLTHPRQNSARRVCN